MRHVQGIGFVCLLAFVAACSGGGGVNNCASPIMVTEPGSIASVGFTGGSFCGDPSPVVTFGDAGAGSACTDPTQCRPTCCDCTVAGRRALTSWCNYGVCARPADVCCALQGTPTNSCGTR